MPSSLSLASSPVDRIHPPVGRPASFARKRARVRRPISRILCSSRIFSRTAMIISLGFELPRTSSDLPEDLDRASRFAELVTAPQVSSYLALHRATLTVPVMSPSPRWALTPPFHPCLSLGNQMGSRCPGHRRFDFCGAGVGLLRLGVTQRPARGVRTFLPMPEASSDHPVFSPAQGHYNGSRHVMTRMPGEGHRQSCRPAPPSSRARTTYRPPTAGSSVAGAGVLF